MAGNNIHSQLTDQAEIHVPKGFTEAPNHSALTKSTAGQLVWRDLDSLGETNNFTATRDPLPSDDNTLGYVAGSRWVNTATRTEFTCVDATTGVAQWRVLIKNNFIGSDPTIADDISQGYSVGSIWTNSSTNEVWICARNDLANAEWKSVTAPDIVGLDHRTLSHLVAPADDHTQYVHIDGRRAMTGDLSLGGNSLTNVLQIDGVKIPDQNVLRVKLNPGSAEYSSVAAAMAAITTASSSNPFAIYVGPGVFIEPQIVMKPYVYIIGFGLDSTIIQAANSTNHLVVGCDNSGISSLVLTGLSAAGKALVYLANTSSTPQSAFWVEDVRFGASDTLVIADGTNSYSNIFINSARFGDGYQFNTGFIARTTGSTYGRVVVRNSTSTKMTSPYPVDMYVCDGAGCEISVKSTVARTGVVGGGGNGFRTRNGGLIRATAADVIGFTEGLIVENVGAASTVLGGVISFTDNTHDIRIDHPGTSGGIAAGANDDVKVYVNPAATSFGFIILGFEDGDIAVSGKIKQFQPNGIFTDLSTLVTNASPVGLLSEGDINPPVSGLTVTVASGYGYLHASDGTLYKITWPDTSYTASPNSTVYLYFDSTGTLQASSSSPNSTQNIIIGRVVSNATDVMIIDESGFLSMHAASEIGQALRNGIGAVYVSGSVVAETGTRQLSVTPGSYYFGERHYLANGGTPVTFTSFYQNGSGGFVNVAGQTTVDNANYDNGTGTLAPLTSGYYAKHSVYAIGDSTGDFDSEKYFLVYAQQEYGALTLAEQASLPNPPNFLSEGVALIASVIVQQGATHIVEVRDERPIISSKRISTVAATTFHSNLLGLTVGDDHPQYWRGDGTHVATGDFNLGTHNITNLGTANGVIVEAHASRHQPGGADAIPTSAASTLNPDQSNAVGTSANLARADHIHNVPTAAAVTLNSNSTNTQGSSTSFARADHTHAITVGTPVTQNTDQLNAAGTAAGFARADHVHNIPTASGVGLNANSTNTQGSSTSFARADHTHAISSAAASTQTPNQVNAIGTSTSFARADHVHNIPTGVATGLNASSTNTQGSASAFAQQDHTHAIASGPASTQNPDQVNATGTSTNFARADHVHNIPTTVATTQTPNQTNAQGSSTSFARADHVHNIPTGIASGLNANSTNTQGVAAAFAQQDHTHAIASGLPITQNTDQANAIGTSTNFARADHVHNIPTSTPTDIGSVNSQGTASTFVKSDHVHKGLHSLQVNAGTQRFGDVNLKSGVGVIVTDNGDNSFTFDTVDAANELVVTNGGSLVANYTAGKVWFNGTQTNVLAGSITLPASQTNWYVYVDVDATVKSAASVPPNAIGIAKFTTSGIAITSLSDVREQVNHNMVWGVAGDIVTILPDASAVAGSTNKQADAGHTHAIATAAAVSQTPNQSNAKGTSTSFARADHIHNIPTGTPSALTPNAGNSQGTAAAFAQQDHIHNVPTAAPANQTIAVAAADGSASTFSRADHIHTFSTAAAVSQTPNSVNAVGTSTSFARADHVHNVPTGVPSTLNATNSNTQGTAAAFAQQDHLHAISTGAASTQTPNQVNATGTSANLARADHVHNIPTGIASTISANSNTQGTAAAFAQQDHTHQLTAGAASSDHVSRYDGSNWQAVYPEALLNVANAWYLKDDFFVDSNITAGGVSLVGELSWATPITGGGSVAANNTNVSGNRPGIVRLNGGGAGGNTAGIILNNVSQPMLIGGGTLYNEWAVNISALSTGTNGATFRVGLGDSGNADFTNGVYFQYTVATSTNWLIKTSNGGVQTSVTTSAAVATGWTKLAISVNAAGTSATFFINGVNVGTISTNLPASPTGFAANSIRTAGTSPFYDIDYFLAYQRFTTSR